MKTDDLIAMLSTNVEQVNRRRLVQIVAAAIAIGAALVIAAVFVVLGIRPDLMKTGALAFLFLFLTCNAFLEARVLAFLYSFPTSYGISKDPHTRLRGVFF